MTETPYNSHIEHCDQCFILKNCDFKSRCNIVDCPNYCGLRFHECKTDDHLEICTHAVVECANAINGCKRFVRRLDMIMHLRHCIASVVNCSSYRIRTILKKSDASSIKKKWPDPIELERNQNILRLKQNADDTGLLSNENCINITEIMLKKDYESLKQYSLRFPLKFYRVYAYIIGHIIDKDYSKSKFNFFNRLLVSVKSKVFKDIETENCIVFNDEEGCSACQIRIRNLENERFNKLRRNKHFYEVLKDVMHFDYFIEYKIYADPKFMSIYREQFLNSFFESKQKLESEFSDEFGQLENPKSLTNEQLYDKLRKYNEEIIDSISFKPASKLNTLQELPCEAFALQYESYRTKETEFKIDCDYIIRRDEFSQHYQLFHNFIFPNLDRIQKCCTFHDYGCNYLKKTINFFYNKTNAQFEFNCLSNNLSLSSKHDYLLDLSNEQSSENSTTIFDLPTECIYRIIDNLDSLSILSLSLTCKNFREICYQFLQFRGIVYPKWCKEESTLADNENDKLKKKVNWFIKSYVYSFSKHLENPSIIKIETDLAKNNFNTHVQNCSHRVVKNLNDMNERVKVYPPFDRSLK